MPTLHILLALLGDATDKLLISVSFFLVHFKYRNWFSTQFSTSLKILLAKLFSFLHITERQADSYGWIFQIEYWMLRKTVFDLRGITKDQNTLTLGFKAFRSIVYFPH